MNSAQPAGRVSRKPGRPVTYVFKPEDELTEKERKMKVAIEKRRKRQNRAYLRKKCKAAGVELAANPSNGDASSGDLASSKTDALHIGTAPSQSPASSNQWSTNPGPSPLDLLVQAGTRGGADASAAQCPTVDVTSPAVVPTSMHVFGGAGNMHAVAMPDLSASSLVGGGNGGGMSFATTDALVPDGEEDQDPTETLVETAMVAAKAYASDATNLRESVDRQRDLLRMTGIKQIVLENLRCKYLSLSPEVQSALRHFIVFPRTFDTRAAISVAGGNRPAATMQDMLSVMTSSNFLVPEGDRFELNDAARLFLNEDAMILNQNINGNTFQAAQTRYLDHYRGQLAQLQDDDIYKVGWLREQAMLLYDKERDNFEFSEFLLVESPEQLRDVLSVGVTVMRYCVPAPNRERILRQALTDNEGVSAADILMAFGPDDPAHTASANASSMSTPASFSECDSSNRARLQLALSEALFDQLKLNEAEEPLQEALRLMGEVERRCSPPTSGIVDSVLVLLLLSNLRMNQSNHKEARQLCIKALKILAAAGLGRSTFGINAMSNLVAIYVHDGEISKADSVATRLLDTLHNMRYTGMPIYADALGVCGMVSMAKGEYREAERQFGTALEIVGKWGSKEWKGIPVQHCLDLDLNLLEGLAEATRCQGRIPEAEVLIQRAREDRASRGLKEPRQMGMSYAAFTTTALPNTDDAYRRPPPRHLY